MGTAARAGTGWECMERKGLGRMWTTRGCLGVCCPCSMSESGRTGPGRWPWEVAVPVESRAVHSGVH